MNSASTGRRGVRIRRKIVVYLVVFVVIVLALLWTFQIFLLGGIYSSIVGGTLEKTGDAIMTAVDRGDALGDIVSKFAEENEMCISVYNFGGRRGKLIAYAHVSFSCVLHSLDDETLSLYYSNAKKSDDGVYAKTIAFRGEGRDVPATVVYTQVKTLDDGSDIVVFLNCAMSPGTATVRMLTVMLVWISVITFLLAVGLASLIAWRVSAPIADVNREAKNLAHNTYDGKNVRRGYREINELSETLTQAAKELTKADRMQKELIANISHDLRTPLTLIEGYTEMMRDIPGENSPENMQVVIDETKRLSTLVSDLLEVSRFQTGKQTIYPAEFDISEAVVDTVNRVMKLYEPDGYRVVLNAAGSVRVNADKTRILQVLYNLIGNAVGYTGEDKTVTVTEEVIGGVVRVSVADSGDGIDEEDLPLIWDRYYKVEGTHRRGVGGSGLGLSIVREILLLHRARFGVSSEKGKGSTFWFELPVVSVGRRPESDRLGGGNSDGGNVDNGGNSDSGSADNGTGKSDSDSPGTGDADSGGGTSPES